MNKLKILPDPKKAGLHEYHNYRWIASEDTEVALCGFEPDQEWYLSKGFLVAEMRDIDPKYARLFAAAPELLEVVKTIEAIFTDPDRTPSELADSIDRDWIRAAIAKATQQP
jgi:hypothetical protein